MIDFTELIIAMLGSSALVSFAQYLITRRDTRKDKASNVGTRLESLEKADAEIREDIVAIRKDVDFSHRVNHLNAKDRVACLTADSMKQGYVTVSNLAYIEEAVALLHEDGENGEMTACLEAVRSLPVGNQ